MFFAFQYHKYIMLFLYADFTSVPLFEGSLSKSEKQLFYSRAFPFLFLSALSSLFQSSRNMGFFILINVEP